MPTRDEDSDTRVQQPTLVVITGLSGAGRTQAIRTFEDFGYFCIDNLPPALIRQVFELAQFPGSRVKRVAIVSDVRTKEFFAELYGTLAGMKADGLPVHVLFLEADDETLVSRFKETRRAHPFSESGSVAEGIADERATLADVRELADVIIDTSRTSPSELRAVIHRKFFGGALAQTLTVNVSSFGFKHGGAPIDSDIVMDVRFLPNPFYDPELRPLDGCDDAVRGFVLDRDETRAFLERWYSLLEFLLPRYLAEGKSHLFMAVGCTGGRHRSVVLAEETATWLRECGYTVVVSHRDIGKDGSA